MDESQDQSVARPGSPGKHDGHRRPVRGKMWELEGRFRVVHTGDPLAYYTDALDQRFGGGQAAG